MSLAFGRGPLSGNPTGSFARPPDLPVVYVEPYPRRFRGRDGDRVLVDSERAVMVHRTDAPPVLAFPAGDVDPSLTTRLVAEAPGFVTVDWRAVPQWFEEDEPMGGHPRNPYHRVDCLRSRRRLVVEAGGVVLVDTDDVVFVAETGLEPRLYVARDHIRMDLLEPSTTRSYCPYKGWASYWTLVVDGTATTDIAWSYDEPFPECAPIAGMLSFYETRAEVRWSGPNG